jgi:hypothetical protein
VEEEEEEEEEEDYFREIEEEEESRPTKKQQRTHPGGEENTVDISSPIFVLECFQTFLTSLTMEEVKDSDYKEKHSVMRWDTVEEKIKETRNFIKGLNEGTGDDQQWKKIEEALKTKGWKSEYGISYGLYQYLLEFVIEKDDLNSYVLLTDANAFLRYPRSCDTYQLIRASCRCGSLKILTYLKEVKGILSCERVGCWSLKQVIRGNHQELFDWLMDQRLVRNDDKNHEDSAEEAASLGRLRMFKSLIKKQRSSLPNSPPPSKSRLNNYGVYLRLMALGGHWDCFDWLMRTKKLCINSEIFCSMIPTAPITRLVECVRRKNPEKTFWGTYPDDNFDRNDRRIESQHVPYRAVFNAIVCKRWYVLEWMIGDLKDVPRGIFEEDEIHPFLLASGGEGSKYTAEGTPILVPTCDTTWSHGRGSRAPPSKKSLLKDLLAYGDQVKHLVAWFSDNATLRTRSDIEPYLKILEDRVSTVGWGRCKNEKEIQDNVRIVEEMTLWLENCVSKAK